MELALEINTKRKNTVFIRYFGHTECLDIDIYYNGWRKDKKADYSSIVYSDLDNAEEKLNKVIGKLKVLKGGINAL